MAEKNLGMFPPQPLDYFTKPFARFLRIEAAAGIILLICAACAIGVSNSAWSAAYLGFWEIPAGGSLGVFEFSRSLKHWINDGLMTLFFFVVALELKREIVLGELRHPRLAMLSLAGALGGMAAPAIVYLLIAGGGTGAKGWGVVMATDTAFVVGCLALLGSRIPPSLRVFLLSLAVFDDVGAILVVAIGYSSKLSWLALTLSILGFAGIALMARIGMRSIPLYFTMGGLTWLALDASGIHATLAGILLGLMTPAYGWVKDNRLREMLNRVLAKPGGYGGGDVEERLDLQRAGRATRETLSPIERLEAMLHPWVAFVIMPLFALANAGVPINPEQFDCTVATAIFAGFVLGKPLGVVLMSSLAVWLRLAVLPPGLNWRTLAAGALLTGIGFTMALFIAELAFDSALLVSAKLGILAASALTGLSGLLSLFLLSSKKASNPA